MANGTVKSFDPEKGKGIILPEDGSDEVAVDMQAVEDAHLYTLIEGERVSYDVDTPKVETTSPKAGNLRADNA